MNFTKSLAIAAIVMGLGATSLAKVHDDHKGYEKGKKTGWHDGTLPPGQAKKESKEWRKEHKHEADWHKKEAREREREAREHRHHSHEVLVHKQTKPPVDKQREMTVRERAAAVERARKEHKTEVNH